LKELLFLGNVAFWATVITFLSRVAWREWRSWLAFLARVWAHLAQIWGRRAPARDVKADDEYRRLYGPAGLAAFVDPFDGHMSPEEIVRYSFTALEVWGREHECPRREESTIHEFAQDAAAREPDLAREFRLLADLYAHVTYAPGGITNSQIQPLRRFWRRMSSC
jgi:hypothetical protein